MPMIQYREINFSDARRALIFQANEIIADYKAQGYTLTLRQLYYQFVARDLIPNNERSYKNLGSAISDARDAGEIDWLAIEDRGRGISPWLIEEDEQEVLNGIEGGFALDYWARQNAYVEVWVEKDALSSVIAKACEGYRVPYMPCKGYLSASEAWRAGRRFMRATNEGRRCLMIHLGDHDPSGIDMTRDNEERLLTYSFGADLEVKRIALNMEQVREFNPPENPAKITDSRAADYISKFGYSSWELDALEPRVLEDLIRDTILAEIDGETWQETMVEEQDRRRQLAKLHDNWPEVEQFLRETQPDFDEE